LIEDRARAKVAHLDAGLDGFLNVLTLDPRSGSSARTGARPQPTAVLLCMRANENSTAFGRRSAGNLDALMLKLPWTLFPKSVDDVQSVVALYWDQEHVGSGKALSWVNLHF
jgi:hypothetical protein